MTDDRAVDYDHPTPRLAAEMDDDICVSRNTLWADALASPGSGALLLTDEERRIAQEIADATGCTIEVVGVKIETDREAGQ